MKPKNTFLLVVVAGGLFAFIFFFERHLRKPEPGPSKVMTDLRPDALTGLQIILPGQKIALEHSNGAWQMTYPRPFPAQSRAIENLVRAAAELSPQTRISAQELKGRLTANEEFGFDNPQATLVFEQGAQAVTLKLGSLTMPGDQIYAQVVGQPNVDIIDADFFKKLVPHQVNDWRDTSFLAVTNLTFDRIIGSLPFELRRDSTNEPWRMTKPVQSRADNHRIQSLLYALQTLRIARFVSDDPKTDLEPFGLQPAAFELKFDLGTNHLLAIQFGKSPTNEEGLIYARINGQNSIVLVPRDRVAPWAASFQEFRDRHLVRFAEGPPDIIEGVGVGKVDSFTVQRQSDDSWRVTKPLDLPADPDVMRAFLTNLACMEVMRIDNRVAVDDGALPDDTRYGLAAPGRRYVLKKTRNATNETIAELDFGAIKDDHIFARRADLPEESSVYAIKLPDFAKLPQTAFDLRRRAIWNYETSNILSIVVHQNGKDAKFLHNGEYQWTLAPGSIWLFHNGQEVEVAAQELGLLKANTWVERGDEDQAHYGFTDKSVQISIEVKDETSKSLFVVLGGIAPNGFRYGKVRMDDGLNWIFEFEPSPLDQILTYLNIRDI